MRVAVVDFGSGNLMSACRALRHAARLHGIAADVFMTAEPEAVLRAERIVLPGQGAFADCAAGLARIPGLREALRQKVEAEGAPFLGICVGMQLLADEGVEHGPTRGFGWVGGRVTRMAGMGLRLPHMGWNTLSPHGPPHALLAGIAAGMHAYFVHSYAMEGVAVADVLATTDYGGPRVAMVARGNCAGTQFHVEKSQAVGLRILANFLQWRP